MHRVFLDANVLFSAAYKAGSNLFRLWKLSTVELVTSAYAVEEVRCNLRDEAQRRRLDGFLDSVQVVGEVREDGLPTPVDLPEKDRPILLGARRAGATFLLTGDKRHFERYFGREVAGVVVLTPGEFLERQSRGP